MDYLLNEFSSLCPYCDATITLIIDVSQGNHSYIEDCEVCCRPIIVHIRLTETANPEVILYTENEVPY